nr:probable sucrose-phosphate synthase 3 [Tanacetum cinerariifolium]
MSFCYQNPKYIAFHRASKSEDGYICTVIEMFEGVDGILYFRAQWFYRAKEILVFPSSATYPKHHKQKDAPDIYRLAAKTKAAAYGLPMVATKNGDPVDIQRAGNNKCRQLLQIMSIHSPRVTMDHLSITCLMIALTVCMCSKHIQVFEGSWRLLLRIVPSRGSRGSQHSPRNAVLQVYYSQFVSGVLD